MPDPRPLSSLRLGGFDQPPARTDSSPPHTSHTDSSRNGLMPQPREITRDGEQTLMDLPLPTSGATRTVYARPSTRRRRRSPDSTRAENGRSSRNSSEGEEVSIRRYKRRRLDGPTAPVETRQGIRYGWYGQVEPGRLKMELVSCDGGEHRDPRHPETSLGAENLLGHDKSVYCSVRPSINLVLRHADDSPFCLEQIHIVGPDYGFTAPVREGLAYVAMTMKDLEKYLDPPPHARRSIPSPPPRRQRDRQLVPADELLSFTQALRDPAVNAALEQREWEQIRNAADAQDTDSPAFGNETTMNHAPSEPHCEVPTSDPSDTIFDSDEENMALHDRQITLLSDEEIGPEDNSPQAVLDYRLQRLRLARRRQEAERFDSDERWAGLNHMPPSIVEQVTGRERETGSTAWGRLSALMARSRVHDSSSPERDSGLPRRHPRYSGPNRTDGDSGVVWAPFSIRRDKHKVAIKFDPPVSGRFVLLKLWANKSNVDVQSVILKGYGGCRFFPAIEIR